MANTKYILRRGYLKIRKKGVSEKTKMPRYDLGNIEKVRDWNRDTNILK